MIQARVANPKQLVHWACVVQASINAQDIVSNKTLNLGSYFGFSCAYNTMIRFVNDWKSDILKNINMGCKQENRIKACLDNNQCNFSKRYQKDGSCSDMLKVTATCIGKCLVTFDVLNKANMEDTVPLTYVNQMVPSPLNMFPYEKYIDSSRDILNCIELVQANNVLSHDEACHIDVIGNRVASYYDVQSYYFWEANSSKVLPIVVGGTGWCRRCVEGRKVRRLYHVSTKGDRRMLSSKKLSIEIS